MDAGKLRDRVTIQSKSVVRDTYGAETITWSDVATVWAAVEPVTGREYLQQEQVRAQVTVKIRIRYRSGITPTMRAIYGTHVYNIEAVLEDLNTRRESTLMCSEVL